MIDCCILLTEVGGEWEEGNLSPARPASAAAEDGGEWEDGNLTPAKPTLAAAQGAARYWGGKAWALAPTPLLHVPAPAPAPVRAAWPGVGKIMASWAHQAAAQVPSRLKAVPWPRVLSRACCCLYCVYDSHGSCSLTLQSHVGTDACGALPLITPCIVDIPQ